MVGLIVSASSAENDPFKALIKSSNIISQIVILGDISYILYLIHWPLITYSRIISESSDINYFSKNLWKSIVLEIWEAT